MDLRSETSRSVSEQRETSHVAFGRQNFTHIKKITSTPSRESRSEPFRGYLIEQLDNAPKPTINFCIGQWYDWRRMRRERQKLGE